VEILGLIFAGSSSDSREQMAAFVERVLGLPRTAVDGIEADLFDLPDGSRFAVASAGGMGTERTIGFLVADLDAALEELIGAGVETDDEIAENAEYRYVHFRAPDGGLYELVERRGL
jgi:catechol 2,3-dioxygenase-like lactoylglutathione lyase family enzyme